jgi:probable F420-dependent oxidoreductase
MKVGWHLPHIGVWPGTEAIDAIAERAEELGFDSLWTADHIVIPTRIEARYPYNESGAFGPGSGAWPWLDPLALLGYVAGRTRRVALGTSVVIVPYRHPLVMAKLVAGLDVLSQGRILLGVGVGWMEDEFRALGIGELFPVRGRVTDEYISAMRAVWSADEASFSGEFVRFEHVSALPRPVQQPGPPIWVGGNTTAALRRAARLGDGWQPYTLLPEEIAAERQRLAGWLREAGREAGSVTISLRANVRLARSSVEATGWSAMDPRQVIAGTPDEVIAQVRAYASAGVEHIFFSSGGGTAATLETIALFAREVLPALR